LHYSSDGIHVLGYTQSDDDGFVTRPSQGISRLGHDHPYHKIGHDKIEQSLKWYVGVVSDFCHQITISDHNELAISPAGIGIPLLGSTDSQATMEKIDGKNIEIVTFRGHRDFPADLMANALNKNGISTHIIQIDPPGEFLENAALAKSFDALENMDTYFATIKAALSAETNVVLFPAVMGFTKNSEVLAAAERVLDVCCLEVPTLPPSVPGMRLDQAFDQHLKRNNVAIHMGAEIKQSSFGADRDIALWDVMGRKYETSAVVLSTGGVLMGGLEVDSYGAIHEMSLGLDTYQSEPLEELFVDRSLNALHSAGVTTDNALRPTRNGGERIQNIFVTGRTLAHWNPAAEISVDGVSIATGFAAAENAHHYLEGLNNG